MLLRFWRQLRADDALYLRKCHLNLIPTLLAEKLCQGLIFSHVTPYRYTLCKGCMAIVSMRNHGVIAFTTTAPAKTARRPVG